MFKSRGWGDSCCALIWSPSGPSMTRSPPLEQSFKLKYFCNWSFIIPSCLVIFTHAPDPLTARQPWRVYCPFFSLVVFVTRKFDSILSRSQYRFSDLVRRTFFLFLEQKLVLQKLNFAHHAQWSMVVISSCGKDELVRVEGMMNGAKYSVILEENLPRRQWL